VEEPVKKEAGLWIDHRKAVIVIVTDKGEETKEITSNIEKHVRYSGGSHSIGADGRQQFTAEDQRDRKYANHLNRYYDEVVTYIHDAETIQIFGPGEAKGELEKHLKRKNFAGHIDVIETVDKMTDRQIAAKVRLRFKDK
jgi:hypothetical protein